MKASELREKIAESHFGIVGGCFERGRGAASHEDAGARELLQVPRDAKQKAVRRDHRRAIKRGLDKRRKFRYNKENRIEKAMTKTDLKHGHTESRGRWKPGRLVSKYPIPSELKRPKALRVGASAYAA